MNAAAVPSETNQRRAKYVTGEELMRLREHVMKSVVTIEKDHMGETLRVPGTIIAATPTFCYLLLHRDIASNCKIVFPDGSCFTAKSTDFCRVSPLAVVKISHGSVIPVKFSTDLISFLDKVYLYTTHGLMTGNCVNPKGESTAMNHYIIDNAPDISAVLGGPVFDETGDFVGMVFNRPDICHAMGVSTIKRVLQQNLPQEMVADLASMGVL